MMNPATLSRLPCGRIPAGSEPKQGQPASSASSHSTSSTATALDAGGGLLRPGDETLTILQRLLQRAQSLGVRLKVLYLDRGFCSGPVIRYLQATPSSCCARLHRPRSAGPRANSVEAAKAIAPPTLYRRHDCALAVVTTLVPGKDKQRRRRRLSLPRRPRLAAADGLSPVSHTLRHPRLLPPLTPGAGYSPRPSDACLRFFLLGFALLLVNLCASLRLDCGPHPDRATPRPFAAFNFTPLSVSSVAPSNNSMVYSLSSISNSLLQFVNY